MSQGYGIKLKLLAAFRHVMAPLVRILIRNGIPFHEASEELRIVFVQVAANDLVGRDGKASVPRVAVMTGLSAREVQRVIAEGDRDRSQLASNANRLAMVLQGWHTDPKFLGPYGFPRDLFLGPDPSGAPSFSDLVASYAAPMAPTEMLEELLRVKAAVQMEASGLIRVQKRTYIPEHMAPELIEVFARGVRRYTETIDHNIRESDPQQKRFERWVFPDDGICESDWLAFRDMVHERLQQVIEDLDTRFGTFRRPDPAADKQLSVGVGLYLFKDDLDDEREFAKTLARLKDD